jgi:hypothetical protein
VLELLRTPPSVDLLKFPPTPEDFDMDSRALLAHSRPLSRRSPSVHNVRSDSVGANLNASYREHSFLTSEGSSFMASVTPPRRFLVDGKRGSESTRREVVLESPQISDDEDSELQRRALQRAAASSSGMRTFPVNLSLENLTDASTPKVLEGRRGSMMSQPDLAKQADALEPPLQQSLESGEGKGADQAVLEMLSSGMPSAATALAVFPVLVRTGEVGVLTRTGSKAGYNEMMRTTSGIAPSLFCSVHMCQGRSLSVHEAFCALASANNLRILASIRTLASLYLLTTISLEPLGNSGSLRVPDVLYL